MYFQICRRLTISICEKHIRTRQIQVIKEKSSFIIARRIHSNIMSASVLNSSSTALPAIEISMDCGNIVRFNNIGKSQQDNRDYRGLKLANGLKVLLVSDPVTDKSSAALTVDVGHMSDPDGIPGLAHFCEHMLFLGTEKYPNENAYSTFLSENGGSSNASTYADNTKYYFDIVPSQLEGALDRFAQFFISPLFTESATEREINAVDSEHDKNVAIDVWRIRQVSKSLADPNHPYSKFGTGNKKTLLEEPLADGINVRDELIKFHDKWYSANMMSLAVYGKESLDELETMVASKFSGIVNKNVVAPRWNDAPFLDDQQASKVSIVPVKDSRSLTISFPTGDLEKHYKSSPEQYLSHLLGHEGKGSILSELKSKGWCNSLMAGHSTSARGFGFFDISVDLSKEGFENVDEIIKIIFQYINMLKANDPKKWIFEEYCNLSEMQFRFKDKDTPLALVSGVVHSMQLYPLEEVLTAPYLVSEWRPDLIEDLQKDLSPATCRVIVVGQKLESIADSTEKWYGTKYHWEKLDKKLLEEWSNCGFNSKLSFPNTNPFIPTDFNLYPIEADVQKIPIIIHDTPVMRVWFKQDTEFLKPKAIMNFDFSSPLAYADPLNCDLTHMFVHLFKDELNEYLYEADLAGLRMGVSNTANGISLSVSGYSDRQQVLLAKILDQMFNFEFDEKRFEIIKEQLMRALKNFKAEQPYQHAVYFLALLLTEHAWTKQELIDAVALITIERLQQYIKDFLSRMHVECFIHGNVNKQKALDLAGLVEKKLDSTHANVLPLLSRQLMLKREYKLVTSERYLFETENEFHKSSCASVYLQCGPQDDRSNVFIDLVTQILSEPCYNQLRTKEQLGYIVFCGARKANGVHGIRFIVQSAKHPIFVEERIKVFLDSMVEQLTNMTDDEFERHKEALAAQKLEKPKRLSTQFNKFLNEISLQQYHFERAEKEVVILRTVTKAELIDYYENFILFSGPRNCALSIHIVSTADGGIGTSDVAEEKPARPNDMVVISDLAAFKSSKELYAVAQPYINIQPKGGKSHMSDPDGIPGLAHFCEHMLFLGTEKYPNENAYSTFLSENGGSSNASTYADNTKYYFDIVPSQLEGALDRFAQFFISPLFTESATEREINAVDSEHDKNVAIDVWRIRQVSKSLADPNHPYSKFGTGNKKTLLEEPLADGINVRDELIKFHDKWYSANMMSLAVYGKESLDELETMVASKLSGIVNKNVVAPRWNDAPFLDDQQASKVSIVPVKDSRSLTISFPTGDLEKHYKSSPEQYLSHLLGHEGKGSILSELKSKGWCNSLMAGHSTSARGFGFFDISVDLSKEGFENVDEIIKIIFQYINMLKANDPKKWIFEEYCNLSEMQFRFKDKDTPLALVSGVVHSMQLYPLEEVLTAPYLVSEWRPDLIEDLQKDLSPATCRVIVVGQKLESIADSTEKWYGTKYHWEKLDKKLLEEWSNCGFNSKLSFPNTNPFIPTDFNLYPIEADVQKIPIIIHDTPVMRVWFKQDTEFLKPKAIMNFDFSSPLAYADPLNCDLTHMFVHLFKDELNEYLYEADLAGLRMGVSNTANGISLSVSGYSDRQQVLLAKILDQMFNFEFDEKRFEIIKEQLMRALKNFKAEQPYQHAVYFLALLLTEHAWTKQELIDAVALITIERLQQYIKDFLSRMHVECFIHGNVNKQKALDLAGLVEKKLDSTHANVLPLLSRQLMLKREYKLVTSERYLFETENEFHKSSCASVYLQCGPQDDRSNVFIDLVTQILSEPCYNQLRTKEQLGYIVFCGARKANGVHGIRFIVQSAKHPIFVEERIKVFLDSMVEQLTNMTDDEFERHKEALAAQKLEKPKRLSTQFNKFLNEISLQQYHFERAEKEVVILRTVTKAELIDYYENFILFSGPRNCALSIHIVSTADGGIGTSDVAEEKPARPNDMVVISDLAAFKSSKELYAVAQPYINIQPKGGKSKL